MKELLTIKEFAEMVGFSVQGIYKRLNTEGNPLKDFLVVENKTKFLKREALELFEDGTEESSRPSFGEEESSALLPIQAQMIEILREQLEEKDKQISSLLARIEEQSKLLSQQQTITALLEQKNQEKRSFWKRVFRKGKEE